jgi:hypothetical protein
MLQTICQIAVLCLFALWAFYLKGVVIIQTCALTKEIPLFLAVELLIVFAICVIVLYNTWKYIWAFPNKVRNLIQTIKNNNCEKQIIRSVYSLISPTSSGLMRKQSFYLSNDHSITLLVCQALIAEKSKDWSILKECGNAMLSVPSLEALGHIYLANVHKQLNCHNEEISELLIAIHHSTNNIAQIIKNQLFLAFLRNMDETATRFGEAEHILSKQQMSILFSEQAITLPTLTLYTNSYNLDGSNVDANCFMVTQWPEAVGIKKMLVLLQNHPNIKIFDKIISVNTTMNRLEIYNKINQIFGKIKKEPEHFFILAKAAIMAGLPGEALHYINIMTKIWSPLVSPKVDILRKEIHKKCQVTDQTINVDKYECQRCKNQCSSWKSYCSQCGEIYTMKWIVTE